MARELLSRQPAAAISFAGTANGIEARVIPREGFALDLIRSGGLKGKSLVARARGAALRPARARRRVADRHRAAAGSGDRRGRVQLRAGRARGGAARRAHHGAGAERGAGSHEQDALAIRAGGGGVVRIDAVQFFGSKAFVSGNPVRPEFLDAAGSKESSRDAATTRVLVFGGSQGAHAINMAMVEAAAELAAQGPHLRITHQTGERDVEMVRAAYARARLAADVEPFLDDMGRQLGQSGRSRLPRRGDDACGNHGGREGGDSDSAADGHRRSPAEERGGAGGERRRGPAPAARPERAACWPSGFWRSPPTDRGASGWRPRRARSRGPTRHG